MVIYHLVDDAISSPPFRSPPFSPVDYRAFIVPFIGRELRLIEIRCRDSSWRNLLLENVSSARISRLLIFNKAESSESSSEESDFNARLLWPIRVETIEGEVWRRCIGWGEFEVEYSNPETMVVVSCWSVDKLGERELLWKHANGFRDGGRLSRLFVSGLYFLSRIGVLTDKGENCSFSFFLFFSPSFFLDQGW